MFKYRITKNRMSGKLKITHISKIGDILKCFS